MRIVIAGGSGFLGRPLAAALARDGHEIVVLTRGGGAARGHAQLRSVVWTPDGETGPWSADIDGAGAVVNLAGESIAGRRWSDAQKQRILDSRLKATRSLVAAVRAAAAPPPVLVSGSAVGYYGPLGDEVATEDTPPGSDFLAHVCVQWEAEAMRAANTGTRVVCLRTGIVLEQDGGALPQMLPPFKFGAGGPVGSGRQYWPWIHRDDWIALVRWAIHTRDAAAALNATAPNPVTNAEFARALGRAMHRPAFVPAPAFALRLMLGEMADALLLSGQRAVPARAERLGFGFRYPRLDEALGAIFNPR
jgi:uncharacterized protein (TIGR01777 family)